MDGNWPADFWETLEIHAVLPEPSDIETTGTRPAGFRAPRRRTLVIGAALLALALALLLAWRSQRREHRFDPLVRSVAAAHGLPPDLVKAVVWRESGFHPDARGGHGELGLMQVTETAAQEWADSRHDAAFRHSDTLDATTNLQAGCFYLAKLSRRYLATDRPYAFALADYNAGRGNVLRWMKGEAVTNSAAFLDAMTFPGTRDYVTEILRRQVAYRRDF